MASFSLIIRNGHIIDGKNNPPLRADIGVNGDRIEKIGDLALESGDREIDARNRYVVPGFIDVTSHSDTQWTLFDFPHQESLLWQGVTTILGGNCGTSLAPLVSGQEIEALQKWTDVTSRNVNWQSVGEYMEEMERHPLGINVAMLVGFGTLRRGVVSDINGPASSSEIEKMKYLLSEAIQEGAFGLSTSLDRAHEQSAAKTELIALAEVLKSNTALLKHHIRNEGEGILPAISEVLSLSRELLHQNVAKGNLATHISHFKILGKQSWRYFDEVIGMFEQAQRDGIPLTVDIFPYTYTNSNLYLLLPLWAREGGKDEIITKLSDVEKRVHVHEELKALTLHYDRMIVASTFRDETAVGKTIAELAEDTGLTPEDVIINLLVVNNLQVTIFNEVISPEHIVKMAEKKYTLFATDGAGFTAEKKVPYALPHPRSFGTFPKVLHELVKEKSILSWEEAIYRMTGLPARLLGMTERGVIAEKAYADVVVLHPEIVIDKGTYKNPFQYAHGIEWVCVNGHIALGEGRVYDEMHGKMLRKQET